MAIFCTFLFADPSEKDVLLAKLHIENSIVNHWFVVDSAYGNTGRYKGHHIKSILEAPEFEPFRNRITAVEYEKNAFEELANRSINSNSMSEVISNFLKRLSRFIRHQMHYLKKALQLKSINNFLAYLYDERYRFENRLYFRTESFYRDLTKSIILEKMEDSDYLFISDVDEILDGQTSYCITRLAELTDPNRDTVNIYSLLKRKRLWDYHNLDTRSFSYVPLVRGRYLKTNPDFKFNLIRQTQITFTPYSAKELVHEYSPCYPIEGLMAKYSYHVDLSFTQIEEIELSLKLNKNIGMPGLKPNGFLEFVNIEDDHQPDYIVDNFDTLRTRLVDGDYRKNRMKICPDIFGE
jgi:hypothetical protein